jgi:integrase
MRKIGMTSRLKDELLCLCDQSPQNIERLVFGIKDSFKKAWSTAIKEAEIKDLHFHDLRHTGTTQLIRAGVPIAEAMEITGHTQPKTFQRYVNLTVESVNAAASKLDNYLANQTNQG